MTDNVVIDELAIPRSIDAEEAADFIAMTRVRNEIEAQVVGNYDLAFEPAELLPHWQNAYEPKRLLVARLDGAIVARGVYETSDVEGSPVAWIGVEVLERARGRGIGAALLARLEEWAAADSRSIVQGYLLTRVDEPGDRLPSPTGFGAVPQGSPGVRFALAHNYVLEQVERFSRLDLPVNTAELDRLLQQAQDASADYRVVLWSGRTPPEFVEDMAVLHSRMSTDAPAAGLDVDEEVWTAQRVRNDDDLLESSPRTLLYAVAQHVASRRLVGFSVLDVPPETSRPVVQEDTLVLKEHRGHRLGMLVKLANIAQLAKVSPGHPSVTTFNAEENRHMLSVNEAIGFVPVGYDGAFKKVL